MYDIIVTEGIVLKKRCVGEANVILLILTKEQGLLRAVVRSARAEKSKLRYGSEPLTRARFSFVKGRHEWRLVGAEDIMAMFSGISSLRHRAVGRVALLLLRLIQGQEPTPLLYTVIEKGFAAIATCAEEEIGHVECIIVLRILSQLGYMPHLSEITQFTVDNLFPSHITEAAARARPLLIRTINESLRASDL